MKSQTLKFGLALGGLCAALNFAAPAPVRAQNATAAKPTAAKSAAAKPAAPSSTFNVGREEIRRSLWEYFGWGATYPEIRVQPKMEVLDKVEETDYLRWHVRYLVDPDEYGYAYLLIPKPFPAKGQRLPLVLCPHPTALSGKDRAMGIYPDSPPDTKEVYKRAARQYAIDVVRAGFIAFVPDRAAYGERRLTQDETFQKQMAAYEIYLKKRRPGWALTKGKNVWDLQRALDFLTKLEFVDADRIGTIGFSLGAWDSLMLLAMDDRVKTAVVNSGGTIRFRPELWQDEQALRDYMNHPKEQQLHSSSNLMFMLAAGRSMLYLWSMNDPYDRGGPNLVDGFRTMQNALKTNFKKEGKTDISLYLHNHGHDFSPESQALAYAWLKEKLGAPQNDAASELAAEKQAQPTPLAATIGPTVAPVTAASTPVPAEPLRAPIGVKKENFDLYLLVGQSNMAGRGKVEEIDRETNPRVWSLGQENQWVPAQEPLHFDIKNRGVGPGLSFAKAMAQAQTNPQINIGLIPAAVGGTLVEWWLPGAKRHLLEDAIERAKRAQQTGVLRGILWQQGESDSYQDRPAHYRERLLIVLNTLRRELDAENVPIVIGGLGDFLKSPLSKDVNAALQTVAGEIPNAVFVPASTKGHIGDQLHFNSAAARENGQNMARAMLQLEANAQKTAPAK